MKCWLSSRSIGIALWLQRLNVNPSERMRRWMRGLLTRIISVEPPSESLQDCSPPLISGRALQVNIDPQEGTYGPEDSSRGIGAISEGHPTSMLRCLLVTASLDAGGMDEVVAFLARRLPQHRVHAAVLHAVENEGAAGGLRRLAARLRGEGIDVRTLAPQAGSNWIEAWRPDVISAHDAPGWVLDTAERLSIPYVDTLHGMHSMFGRDRLAEARRGARLRAIVAVSDLVRRQYLETNPTFGPDRIVTIPNGVDDVRRRSPPREQVRCRWGVDGEYVFVSLARVCLQKNTYGLVAAFAEIASRHVEAHLVLAGRPDDAVYLSQVQSLRANLPCRDRIHLRNHSPDPGELLALADGFVLDSFFEGWSLASMEALHAGVPVVVSDVGGAREQVEADATRGFVVPNPVGDPLRADWEAIRSFRYARQVNRQPLVNAMTTLIVERDTRLAARPQLSAESVKRFHPDVCVRRHAQFLANAASRDAEAIR